MKIFKYPEIGLFPDPETSKIVIVNGETVGWPSKEGKFYPIYYFARSSKLETYGIHKEDGIYISKKLDKMLRKEPDSSHSKILRKEIEKLREEHRSREKK